MVQDVDGKFAVGRPKRAQGLAEVSGDDLHVEGRAEPPRGPVRSAGDHRLAMAFAVLGTVPGARVRVDDMSCAAVSFPRFPETLRSVARKAPR